MLKKKLKKDFKYIQELKLQKDLFKKESKILKKLKQN